MKQILIVFFCCFSCGAALDAEEISVPRDGSFYIDSKPAFKFKATLSTQWASPQVGSGMVSLFAPLMPELPSQSKVSSNLSVSGRPQYLARSIVEQSFNKRRMLWLPVKPAESLLKSGVIFHLTYEGITYKRKMTLGDSPIKIPDLTEAERKGYLRSSSTMDFNHPSFVQWMATQSFRRKAAEDATAFSHRVFKQLVAAGKYGGNTSSYEARRPSAVCSSVESDCGGLSLLFVAVMRANQIPARTLFGRWSVNQSDGYGQFHVIAEFFVAKSGWVPVDVSGTIVHKPKNPDALFGNTDGQLLVFHVDSDLEPVAGFRHAWAQYILLQWTGTGDFWKGHKEESKWSVQRSQIGPDAGGM